MKTPILYAMTAAWLWLGPALSFAQPADAPPENPPPGDTNEARQANPPPAPAPGETPENAPPPAVPDAAPGANEAPTPGGPESAPANAPATSPVRREVRPTSAAPTTEPAATQGEAPVKGDGTLRLNFRNAPLEQVLNYLSEAAGYVIVLETEVRGKLNVWSNQPLNKEEALDLLNRVLNQNGYAAIQDGRTLTIVSRDDAKKRDVPVKTGADPAGIPKNDQMVTQILPIRFVSATQLSKDLLPLFPSSASIAANEGGNALVITDTQANIKRIAEIIRALDTSIASVSAVRVFRLQFADAKALATAVKDLFATSDNTRGGNQQQQRQFFRGGGPFGMPGGGGDQSASSGSGRVSTPKVTAVADELSNSLVVSAPEEQMPVVEDLVRQLDTSVDDLTELRVFRLKYADAQETADLIASLFPDTTTQSGRGQGRFGGFMGPGGQGNTSGAQSTRIQKQSKVTAVADARTGSVVVTAAHTFMEQIAQMITQLDADPAKKQKVYVFSVENTDPSTVETVVRGLFEGQNTRNRSTTSNTRQAGSQLNSRATAAQQNQTIGSRNSSGSFGSSGGSFGGSTTGR